MNLLVVGLVLVAQTEFFTREKLTPREEKLVEGVNTKNISPHVSHADGSMTYVYGPLGKFKIICAVLNVCSVFLQAGEEVTGISLGDPVRWQVSVEHFGSGADKRYAIGLKPIDGGLKTNIQIFTTRRAYNLSLLSTRSRSIQTTEFTYPAEHNSAELLQLQIEAARTEARVTAAETQAPPPKPVALQDLDWAYTVKVAKGNPAWKPLSVGSNDRQTFIRFPSGTEYKDIPIFTVTAQRSGSSGQINYRQISKDGAPIFLVDGLFSEARLITRGEVTHMVVIRYTGDKAPQQPKEPKWRRR